VLPSVGYTFCHRPVLCDHPLPGPDARTAPEKSAGGVHVAYADKTLTCVECKKEFLFSARDQEFHASKGFTNEPKRCPACRQVRRAARGEATNGNAAPVYTGPRARGGARPVRGPARNGRPRRQREEGEGGERDAVHGPRSFGTDSGAYTAPCAACGAETIVAAVGGAHMVLCPACYDKLAAIARA
jgi:hypothetical protein